MTRVSRAAAWVGEVRVGDPFEDLHDLALGRGAVDSGSDVLSHVHQRPRAERIAVLICELRRELVSIWQGWTTDPRAEEGRQIAVIGTPHQLFPWNVCRPHFETPSSANLRRTAPQINPRCDRGAPSPREPASAIAAVPYPGGGVVGAGWPPGMTVAERGRATRGADRCSGKRRLAAIAGEHFDVRLTAEDRYQTERSYSIASASEDPTVALTVERIDDGIHGWAPWRLGPFTVLYLMIAIAMTVRRSPTTPSESSSASSSTTHAAVHRADVRKKPEA